MDELQTQLESILFVANKPATASVLAKLVERDEPAVLVALQQLQITRKDSGIIVMEANGQWQLGTNPQNVSLVKNYLTSDLREKLTDATVEVLGIIAYRQPISKTEIEAIRGVNCQYSIRQLLMRGLIEKTTNPADSRSTYYQLTTEFLQHMGLQSVADLPEFEKLTASIKLPETPEAKVEKVEPEQPTVTTSYT
ncbi:MAG: SMC-Scp complex subunit ScpB, partial [Candidatus Doudnabacteria bacterium]|nr:SMC-Scp complex subunit ScpB [Candidatus Doudnabacteria bacterium]